MSRKGLSLFILFISSIALTMVFQNCGKSSAKNGSSNNGGLQVEVVPNGNTGNNTAGDGSGGDGSGGDGGSTGGDGGSGGNNALFSFDMSRGDSIYYANGGENSLDYRSLRISQKSFYVIAESHIYDQVGTTPNPDLPSQYCSNSSFPHCNHINNSTCQGENCYSGAPVACHKESRMSQAEINNAFNSVNSLAFHTRVVDSNNPYIESCDTPNLSLLSNAAPDVHISLANEACVPHNKYYATTGGENIESIFNTELDSVENSGEICNEYSSYHSSNTQWNYQSANGRTPEMQRSYRNFTYSNYRFDMSWKNAGDMTVYCASNVPIKAEDSNQNPLWDYEEEFFPNSGLSYSVLRTGTQGNTDRPIAFITYQANNENGRVRQFFMDQISAVDNGGGAILESSDAQTITNTIELLIAQANDHNYTSTNCP